MKTSCAMVIMHELYWCTSNNVQGLRADPSLALSTNVIISQGALSLLQSAPTPHGQLSCVHGACAVPFRILSHVLPSASIDRSELFCYLK